MLKLKEAHSVIKSVIQLQQWTTVLDPFMGSGTTAVACLKTGRNFIGFELSKQYHDVAQARIAETIDSLLEADTEAVPV